MQRISKDYKKFLEELTAKHSVYEKFCNFSEKILPISPGLSLSRKLQEAINFSHLRITPKGAFSFMILATIIVAIVPLIIGYLFGFLSVSFVILSFVFTGAVFYYLYDYPFHYSIIFRIKASAEMVLAIVYMTIAMRVSPNIENAVKFAADHLTGPLARDLKELIWEVYSRKFESMSQALETFIYKWRRENEEFTEAIYLIKTSTFESTKKREEALDEAVSLVLNGTRERMKHYAQDLKIPVTVLNALGILLPIIGMIFFPIMGMFMPEVIRPIFIIIGYNILLPISVFWLMKIYLDRRPYTFHQPDISKHPKFAKERLINKAFILGLIIPIPFIAIGWYQISLSEELFSFEMLAYSLLITLGISFGVVTYSILSVIHKMKLREEIAQIENEFAEALFQVGNQLTRGIPIENVLENITPRIENMKISKLFERILYNIKTFGMTLEQAVFDKDSGAIKEYPSRMISAVMRAIVEISKRGMSAASKAMITVSNYLKDVHVVEEELKDMMEETTSTMHIQAVLLAPLSSGIVVALAALMMKMMIMLKGAVEKIYGKITGYGPMSTAGEGILSSLINLDKMIPVHSFQLVVGIYMLEVVGMLAIFVSIIQNGDENLLKRLTLGKMLLIAVMIYSVVLIILYSVFDSLMPIMGLTA